MRNRHFVRGLAGTLMMLIALFLFATPALAQGGGQFVFGDDYTLESGEQLNGGLAVFGGSVELEPDSQVYGDVFVAGGNLVAAGRITGDLAVFGGDVRLTESAVVTGDLVAVGGNIDREEGSVVLGEAISAGDGVIMPGFALRFPQVLPDVLPHAIPIGGVAGGLIGVLQNIVMAIFSALALAALGVILLLFLEQPVRRMGDTVTVVPWASVGMGLLTMIVIAAVTVILVITICLSPLALLLVVALAVAVLLGWTVAGLLVGERILIALNIKDPSPLLSVAVGVLLLSLLTHIPCLGWLLGLLVTSTGLGAVVLTRAGTVPYPVNGVKAAGGEVEDLLPEFAPDESEETEAELTEVAGDPTDDAES